MKLLSEHPFLTSGNHVRMYGFPNGLKVILYRDPSAPVLAYQTWYQVGSRHERDGITGIAHLFEHLMFNQTSNHPPGEFDKLIESVGGETNAATWVDWTYYRDSLPATDLELAISLESDRMAHLVLGDKQVESEREVVANERRFRVEDDVDGFMNEELYKLAFTQHPYHWPTIGWMRDIKAITIEDCRQFYRTYYAPNNAIVVMAGDFDEAKALDLIARDYGGIAAQQIPAENARPEPAQTAERRVEFDKPTSSEKLRIGYKSYAHGHADYAVLELISEVLFGGNSSRLYRRLVSEKEVATSVSGFAAPFRDAGLYEVALTLKRGHDSATAEALVYEALDALKHTPVSDAELQTAQNRLRTRFFMGLRTNDGKAESFGHYQTVLGDYRHLFSINENYAKIDKAAVMRVASDVMRAECRTVVIARPTAEEIEDDGEEIQ